MKTNLMSNIAMLLVLAMSSVMIGCDSGGGSAAPTKKNEIPETPYKPLLGEFDEDYANGGFNDQDVIAGISTNGFMFGMGIELVILQNGNSILVINDGMNYHVSAYNGEGSNVVAPTLTIPDCTTFLGSACTLHSAKILSNGKILVSLYTAGMPGDAHLLRLNSNGSLDTGYGVGGKFTFASATGALTNLAVQRDGKVLGTTTYAVSWPGTTYLTVVRVNGNGTIDSDFGTAGSATIPTLVNVSALLSDEENNDFYIAGAGTTMGSGYILKFDSEGNPDNTYGTGGFADVSDPAMAPMTSTGVAGMFLDKNNDNALTTAVSTQSIFSMSTPLNRIFRLKKNGQPDLNFGTNGVKTLDYSSVLAVGEAPSIYKMLPEKDTGLFLVLATLNTFGSGMMGMGIPATSTFVVSRFDAEGNLDSSFGDNGNLKPTSSTNYRIVKMEFTPEDKLLLAGYAYDASTSCMLYINPMDPTSGCMMTINSEINQKFVTIQVK